LRATFYNYQTQKNLGTQLSTVKVLVMSIIFAEETMGTYHPFSVLDSSKKFAPKIIKKILIFFNLDHSAVQGTFPNSGQQKFLLWWSLASSQISNQSLNYKNFYDLFKILHDFGSKFLR
jgi:hypothetical protein